MPGLEALLRVKRVAEDEALMALSVARSAYERERVLADSLAERVEAAKEKLRSLERSAFDVRQSILYRRYLNGLRGHIGRCRRRMAEAKEEVDAKRRSYEAARHAREAVGEVIEKREAAQRELKQRREEREIGDLALQHHGASAGSAGGER